MALAESAVEDIEKQSLKCRKCRFLVIEDPPHKILNISDTGLLTADDSSNTFNICDETLPYWISAAIEEVIICAQPTQFRVTHCHEITLIPLFVCRQAGPRGSSAARVVDVDLEGSTT